MSALTSLLVRDQVVPVRKIEDAIQRQVISGGDIETVLLEMGVLPENVMSAYRAALYGLLPATREEVMTVSRETLRAVPKEVAAQYRLVPLSAEDKTLVVAVTAPLSIEDDEQLGFLLGQDLVYRIVSDVRLAAALSHHYNIEAAPRMRRLADKLRGRDAGRVPYVAPPETAKVDGKTADLPSKANVVDWDDEEDTTKTPAVPEGTPTQKLGTPVVAPEGELEPADSHLQTERPPPPAEPEVAASAEPQTSEGRQQAARSKIAKKLRGPLTAKAGVELLREAEGRDEILEIFFVFARQFFDFTALFVVHDDIAEGRDAHGEGMRVADIRQMAVPLDVPGTFSTVKSGLVPMVTDLSQHELDVIVARDLDRTNAQPSIVAPVAIKKRVVLMLYGDRSGEAFSLSDLPELIGFLPRVADSFLALLVKRKREGYASSGDADRPALKSAATRITAGAVASEPTPDKSGYRPSKEPPAPEPAPIVEASVAAQAVASADESIEAPDEIGEGDTADPLGVLGVPRSAPPPPMTDGTPAFNIGKKPTRPDGHAAIAARRGRGPGAPAEDAAPEGEEVVIEYDDEGDETSDGRGRPGGESELPAFAKSQTSRPADGGYQMSGSSEVLGRADAPRKKRSRRRKTKAQPADDSEVDERADPRAEGEAAAGRVEKVDVPDVDAVRDRDTEPNAERRASQPRSAPNMPSVIVDMGDTVEVLVDDLERCGPDDEGTAVDALLSLGEASLPTLTQRFPGPLWFDRKRPHRRLPRGRDISAIARAFAAFRETAIPYVISLLEARDPDVRFYGTLLASEFVSKELLVPVGGRIFDRDPGTQLLAVDVLRRFTNFEKEMEELLKGVRVEARVDRKDAERRRVAARALGLLRDVRSVELLIELLAARDHSLAEQARKSLILLTRQDFGDSQRKWTQWFERNKSRHRVEWLIDSLVHADESIRAAAGDELQLVTQEYYGYHPRLPKRDREVARGRYQKWWDGEGRARFSA